MATQKNVTEAVKAWQSASSMKTATEAAGKAAIEFDGLYEESAKNLLGRSPDLLLLLSAFLAGKEQGIAEQKAKATSVQETLA